MPFRDIIWEIDDNIGRLTLNKPEKLNALSNNSWAEIEQAIAEANENDDVRAVLITGAGRGFCSGTDLTYTGDLDVPRPFAGRAGRARTRMLCAAWVYHCEKPTIAAVNGVCVGAGLSLALACDIRVASTESKFSSIFIKRAISPDTGTSWLLPRLIGMENALKMMYTGNLVSGLDALKMGLVSETVEPEVLLERAESLAKEIASGPSVAVEIAKRLAHDGLHRGLDEHVEIETFLQGSTRDTEDIKEGRLAFVEKREPIFKGR